MQFHKMHKLTYSYELKSPGRRMRRHDQVVSPLLRLQVHLLRILLFLLLRRHDLHHLICLFISCHMPSGNAHHQLRGGACIKNPHFQQYLLETHTPAHAFTRQATLSTLMEDCLEKHPEHWHAGPSPTWNHKWISRILNRIHGVFVYWSRKRLDFLSVRNEK